MWKTLSIVIGSAGAISAFAMTAPATAMPVAAAVSRTDVSDVVQVRHRARRHHRPHFVVRPDPAYAYGYPYAYPRGYTYYPDYYATYRGFADPGFAVRGNMPGCAVDLGYGALGELPTNSF